MKRRGFALCVAVLLGLGTALLIQGTGVRAQPSVEPGAWTALGPEGGGADALAVSPEFAADGVAFGGNSYYIRQFKTGLGLFKSTDGGRGWTLAATTQETDTQITGVDALAVSPAFGADGTVFAGTSHWLFKSTDAGTTWHQVEEVGSLLFGVSAVAVAPDYAASGHVMATSGNMLYVSENGGVTWTMQSELGRGGTLAYSPDFAHDRTAFVGGDGIWRTTNSGITWTRVLTESAWTIAVSPDFANDRTLFTGGFHGLLTVSHDGGTTWVTHTVAMTASTINALVVSPAYVTDTTVFAGCHGGLFRSEDGGVTWTPEATYPGPWVESLAISPDWPSDPTLLVGTPAGVYRTDDGGATYTRHGFQPLSVSMFTSPPGGQRLFAGSDRQGLFQSADAGARWTPSDLYNKTFVDVAAAPTYPTNPRIFASVAAGAGLGFYRSDNAGQTWGILNSTDIPGGYWAYSPEYAQDGTIFVTGNHGNVLRSTYHGLGANWEPVGTWPEGVSGAARFVLLSPDYPADPTIWAAGHGFWRLAPGATTWISTTLPVPNAEIRDIAQSPDFRDDQTLLATGSGRETGSITDHFTVFRSVDAGATWTTATIAFSDTTPLIAVAFSPYFATDQTAFAASREQCFRSSDSGKHWVAIGAPPGAGQLHDVAAHGYGRVSVATDTGVWQYATDWEEAIVNGGFEEIGGWAFPGTSLPAAVTDVVTHTGRRAARIGAGPGSPIPTATAYSSVQQTLIIPSDTLTSTLHFYYLPKTEETVAASPSAVVTLSPTINGDLQYAMILETHEFLFSELVDADTWLSRTLDLSPYAGQSLTLHFGVANDGQDGHTGMMLDDVSMLNRRLRQADLTERIYLPLVLRNG